MSELDQARMREALQEAESAIGVSDPNPRVGCVIGRQNGELLGKGATQAVGGPHAEVMALRAAKAAGHDVRGATAWVTLEPCAHHGRTPPCCDALIAAGVGRVVVALPDPFPRVDGAGVARLRASGIQVDMADADLGTLARELNIGFFSRVLRQRPWVRAKMAASLDGRAALEDGSSQWITGAAARADGHAWRKRAGAVLTGIGTIVADDPRLDVRLVTTQLQPLRVVLDSRLQLPVAARVLQAPGEALVVTGVSDAARHSVLQDRGAEVLCLPTDPGGIDLEAVLAELARREINEVHVEAGPRLSASLLRAGLVDELLLYQAPKLLGDGRPMAALGHLPNLDSALQFRYHHVTLVGDDLRILARPPASGFLTLHQTPELGIVP